jgi:hypothetical protein
VQVISSHPADVGQRNPLPRNRLKCARPGQDGDFKRRLLADPASALKAQGLVLPPAPKRCQEPFRWEEAGRNWCPFFFAHGRQKMN